MVKKLNLVADDLLLIFTNTYSGCDQVDQELKEFSSNSGLKVNKDKCMVTRLPPDNQLLDQDLLPLFQRNQEKFTYVGFNVPLKEKDLWAINVPQKIAKLAKNAALVEEFRDTCPLGRVVALKSLFFSTLPYFISKLPIVNYSQKEIKRIQSLLDDIVWNGRKPKIKLSLAAFPPNKGGIGMINFQSRLDTLRIHMIQMELNTQHIEFWQDHLYSLFSVPFDIAIRTNLNYRNFKLLYIRNPPLLWQQAFQAWCNFHYVYSRTTGTPEDILDYISRPAIFNAAIGSSVPNNKRFSLEFMDYIQDHGWFSIKDVCNLRENNFPPKRFYFKSCCKKGCSVSP